MMQGKGRYRPLLFIVTSLFCFASPGISVSTPESSRVWFSDHKSLNAVDVATNTVVQRIELPRKPDALAVDADDQGVWVLVDRRLVKFDATGAVFQRIELKRQHVDPRHAKALVLNPYTGTLWLATERALTQLSPEGERLVHWRAPTRIESFALDIDESLWVLTRKKLFHVSSAGALIESLDLNDYRVSARHLAVDSLGGVIWIGGKHRLLKLQLNRLTNPAQIVLTKDGEHEDEDNEENDDNDDNEEDEEEHHDRRFEHQPIDALEVHPVMGTLWVVTREKLLLFDRSGTHLRTIDLPPAGERVNAMAFDSRGLGLWIAGKDGLVRFSGNGDLIATIAAEKETALLGVAGFTLHPSVSVLDPSDGAVTNNRDPAFGCLSARSAVAHLAYCPMPYPLA